MRRLGPLPMLPSCPTSTAIQNVTVKGMISSDVTSWIDIDGHRIVKTHSKNGIDVTINFEVASGGAITLKGTRTEDINPA